MNHFSSRVLVLLTALAVPLAACDDGGDDGDDSTDGTPAADAAPPDAAPILEPPPPGQGLQYWMSTEIPSGVEGEWCMFVQAPPDDFYVNRDEVRFSAGSHHFLLYQTDYTQIPTQKEDGTPVDTSGVFDCSDGATNGWRVNKLVGGSQNGDGDSLLAFPPDVAMKVTGGTVLLMNAHYVNTTEETLTPEVRINLWTIPEAEVAQEGDLLFIYNPFIHVPALGTSRARWRCPVYQDITLANVQSHMHKRGSGYAAQVVGEGAPFYTNDQWEDVPVLKFDPGKVITAGSTLDYYCDYTNGENVAVTQGPRTSNEMCMLIGSYYPVDPRTARCTDPMGNLGGEWVGSGNATCAVTWQCIVNGVTGGGDVTGKIGACINASDPAVSPEMSAAIRCVARTQGFDMCGAEITACEAK